MKMNQLLCCLLWLFYGRLCAQQNMKIFYDVKGDTISYYFDNNEIYPLSIVFSIQLTLQNMKARDSYKTNHVFAGKSLRNKGIDFIKVELNKGGE